MESNFVRKQPGLFLIGTIFFWYVIATTIDLIWLRGTPFSNLFVLGEAYLGMKPLEIPFPESGLLLFFLGTMLIISIYLLTEKEFPKQNTIRYVLGVFGFSFLIFILLIPILVIGEIAYIILIDKLCDAVAWLKWLKDVLGLFSFKAEVQTSFMKNPIKLDMSLGGFLALYIGIPRVRRKLKV
jgi:hypothetical protein